MELPPAAENVRHPPPVCDIVQDAVSLNYVSRFSDLHGDTYYYGFVTFAGTKTKVAIWCYYHGEFFQQTPEHHLRGQGCVKCGKARTGRINAAKWPSFEERARAVHRDRYIYTEVVYVDAYTKVTIICKVHGRFTQTPNDHIQGYGCESCGNLIKSLTHKDTLEDFLKKAHAKFNGLYDYSDVVYVNSVTRIIVNCRKHGPWDPFPAKHLQGVGCPSCTNSGYSTISLEWLVYIEISQGISLRHALDGGEYRIPGTAYKADGYDPRTNTVYEFHGDFWHGNPAVYDKNTLNKVTGITFGQMFQKTELKMNLVKTAGFNYVCIWESDWKKMKLNISPAIMDAVKGKIATLIKAKEESDDITLVAIEDEDEESRAWIQKTIRKYRSIN